MRGQGTGHTRARIHATAARILDKSAAAIEDGFTVARGCGDPETLRAMAREHRSKAGRPLLPIIGLNHIPPIKIPPREYRDSGMPWESVFKGCDEQ